MLSALTRGVAQLRALPGPTAALLRPPFAEAAAGRCGLVRPLSQLARPSAAAGRTLSPPPLPSTAAAGWTTSAGGGPSALLRSGMQGRGPLALALALPPAPPALPVLLQVRPFASRRFHRKKILKAAKGYRGRASRSFRVAIRRVERARQNAYRDRKLKKREFRRLWIQRLNAGVRQHGIRYSRWIKMQREGGVGLDRKVLSGLAMHEPFSFKAIVDVVKARSAA